MEKDIQVMSITLPLLITITLRRQMIQINKPIINKEIITQ